MARTLLDECVDRRFARHIVGHEVRTAAQMALRGASDQSLLARAAGEFDVLITVDRSLPHQQNLASSPLMLVVLESRTSRLADLLELLPSLHAELANVRPGTIVRVRH